MVGLDEKLFTKEFNNLMRVQHKNIIRLVGYCYDIQHKHIKVDGNYIFSRIEERALCFEYLQHGSLDKFLSGTTRLLLNLLALYMCTVLQVTNSTPNLHIYILETIIFVYLYR